MTSLRRLAPAVSLVALLALTACGTDTDSGGTTPTEESSSAEETTPAEETPEALPNAADLTIEAGANGVDLPDGIDAPSNGGTGAAWTAEDGYLYVVTFGSSTCPTVAEGEATLEGSDVVVTFEKVEDNKPCTMDMRAWTTVVKAPEGVDESADVTVKLDEAGSVVLTPRAAAGQVGEAAWVEQS